MNGSGQQGPRPPTLRVRAADGVTAALVGWFALAQWIDQLKPSASRLEKELLLLAFTSLCGMAGLLLVNLASYLREKKSTAAVKIIFLVRICAGATVGGFLLSKMMEGCFATLAVISFIVCLVLVFRALDESRPRPYLSPSLSGVARDKETQFRPAAGSDAAMIAPGVRRRMDNLLASIGSGVTSGLLVGGARYLLDSTGWENGAVEVLLFQVSTIIVALASRFAMARLIQGAEHLKGWKAGPLAVDGLLTGALLAAFMSSARMPFSIYFQHLLERHPISWILAGVGLGFTFGLILSLIAKAVRAFLSSDPFESGTLVPASVDGASYPSVRATNAVGRAAHQTSARPGAVTDGSASRQAPPISPLRVTTLGCSCLIAPLALLASFVFLFVHEVLFLPFFPPKGPPKGLIELPQGCPPECAGLVIGNFDLAGADLAGANFAETKFPDTVLRGANLRGSNLERTYLFWVDLRGADLSEADLSGADLRKAILLGARFDRTVLRGAYLREAALQDLDLSTADLRGADLRGASFSPRTNWPVGFDVESAGMYLAEEGLP